MFSNKMELNYYSGSREPLIQTSPLYRNYIKSQRFEQDCSLITSINASIYFENIKDFDISTEGKFEPSVPTKSCQSRIPLTLCTNKL